MNGYQNEIDFVNCLNRKYVSQLSNNMKDFLYDLFDNLNDSDYIICWKNSINQKSDIFIKINKYVKGVSLKLGHDNSVHSESIQNFKIFLEDLEIPYKVINYYINYHYGIKKENDKVIGKYTAEEYKKSHIEELRILNKYLNRTKGIISSVDRFLVKSANSRYDISAIVSGNPNNFTWIKKDDLYDLVLSHQSDYTTTPHIGNLIIQPKIRNLSGNCKNPKDIFIVQIKWYLVFEDIENFKKRRNYS